jgi:proton-coupled amino acid transporter
VGEEEEEPLTSAEHADFEYAVPEVEGSRDKWVRNAFRSGVVAVTLAVAYGGSNQLDNFVSLIGCFCCTPLAFIYPSLFHVLINKSAGLLSRAADYAIIAFGVGIFVFSTYIAISTWSPTTINPCPYTSK